MWIFPGLVAGLIVAAAFDAASAQDIPGSSPMDHAAMSMAHTSSTIDSVTVGEVARKGRTRSPSRKAAPVTRQRDAKTAAACRQSTPILRSMGLQPHPDCL